MELLERCPSGRIRLFFRIHTVREINTACADALVEKRCGGARKCDIGRRGGERIVVTAPVVELVIDVEIRNLHQRHTRRAGVVRCHDASSKRHAVTDDHIVLRNISSEPMLKRR